MTTIMATMENRRQTRDVRELRVYREAFAVSLDVHKATLAFPEIEQHALADQMRRASRSICASLAEGFSRQASLATEFKKFVLLAAGACAEMLVWTEYAQALGYISAEQAAGWQVNYKEISQLLSNVRNNLESSSPRALETLEEA